jgi:hypothetical protein
MTWIRSERPDGHRSLWCHAGRWFTLTKCDMDVGGSGRVNVHLAPTRDRWVCCAAKGLTRECVRWGLPDPTAADLDWLRGIA